MSNVRKNEVTNNRPQTEEGGYNETNLTDLTLRFFRCGK